MRFPEGLHLGRHRVLDRLQDKVGEGVQKEGRRVEATVGCRQKGVVKARLLKEFLRCQLGVKERLVSW